MRRKKKKDKNITEEKINEIQKELDRYTEDMKVVLGDNAPKIRISEATRKKLAPKKISDRIFEICLGIILLISLHGYIRWVEYRTLYDMFLYLGSIVLLEMIFNLLVNRFLIKAIIYSMGLVRVVPTIIAFVVCSFLMPGIAINSLISTIAVMIVYLIVKALVMFFIQGGAIRIRRG